MNKVLLLKLMVFSLVGCNYVHDCTVYPMPIRTSWPIDNTSGIKLNLNCDTGYIQ